MVFYGIIHLFKIALKKLKLKFSIYKNIHQLWVEPQMKFYIKSEFHSNI